MFPSCEHRPTALAALFLLIPAFFSVSSCGVMDSEQDPDAILQVHRLSPASLVANVRFSSTADSTIPGSPAYLKFTLTTTVRQAVTAGAVVEAVLRLPPGDVLVEGWVEADSGWDALVDLTVSGTDSADVWWRDAWADRTAATRLVAGDGAVRLRATPGADPGTAFLRVVESGSGVWMEDTPGNILASYGSNLLIMEGSSIHRWSTQGGELELVTATGQPATLCLLDDRFYGTTDTEIRQLARGGGSWARVAALPWQQHGGVSITTDGTDLYLIRYPAAGVVGTYPVLYRLSATELLNKPNFSAALLDSTTLKRNGLSWGQAPGFTYWTDERHLVVRGTQDGEFGLVTFTRAGRFRTFIPLPFEEGPVRMAFVGDYIFLTNLRPTMESLGWEQAHVPSPPAIRFLYRWRAP